MELSCQGIEARNASAIWIVNGVCSMAVSGISRLMNLGTSQDNGEANGTLSSVGSSSWGSSESEGS